MLAGDSGHPAPVWRFAPGPVRLNLRATVLWLPWYLLACTLLPALLGGLAGELATVLAGVYLLPFGCLAIGMSLGKRRRPVRLRLSPLVCALCLLDRGRKADSRALPRSRPLRPAGQRGEGRIPGAGRNGLTGRMPFPDAPGVELRRAPFEKRRGQAPALWACGAVTGSSR
ncbi:MAG: hypothetical protein ACLRWQ_05735 [Flavonifractor plautii]